MARIVGIAALLTIFMCGLHFRGTCSVSRTAEGQCSRTVQDITITQKDEGIGVSKKKWGVTISNPCLCTVQDLTVTCQGFDPAAQKIDPSVLAKQGDACLVNNGNPIRQNDTINFTYENDVSFPFAVSNGQIACS
ncbi:hypothetical protein BT93_E0638 [Corymbia citriodora subsp. variegata]|nr:hypothetical protein BT93_E0638 [Corymbia citriodora subsp. variegata]